jgi:HEAT repeat protein
MTIIKRASLVSAAALLFIAVSTLGSVAAQEEESSEAVEETAIDEAEKQLREEIDGLLDTIEKAEDTREKAAAAHDIAAKGKEALPYLVEVFPAKSTEMKGWIAQIFWRIRAPEETKDVLFEDFKKGGLKTSPDVIRVLAKMEDERAAPLLLKLMAEASDEQKELLYYALSEVTDYRTVDALGKGLESDDRLVLLNCVNGLRKLQSRALKEIEEKRRDHEGTEELQKKLDAVQNVIVEGLKKAHDEGKKECQRFLVEVLGKSGDTQVSSVVAPYLNDEDVAVRIEAMNALAELKATFYTREICGLLNDQSANVRRKVPRALAKLGDKEAIPYLIEALYSSDGDLKAESLRALRALSGQPYGMNPELWLNWWQKYQTSPEAR